MFKIKIFISIITFSILLIFTSIIKNQTRETEKNILNLSKTIRVLEKDLNESQLDFSYLSSPSMIHNKIKILDNEEYVTMEYSKIFLNMSSFLDLQNRLAIQKIRMKLRKNKNFNKNQGSFFFEDYIETNKKTNFKKNNIFQDRIYLLFFLFVSSFLYLVLE